MVRFTKLVFHDYILGNFGSSFPFSIFPFLLLCIWGCLGGLKHHAGSFLLGCDIPLVVRLTLDIPKEHSLVNAMLLQRTRQSSAGNVCSVLMKSHSLSEVRNKGSVRKSSCPKSGLEVRSPVSWTGFRLSLEEDNQALSDLR